MISNIPSGYVSLWIFSDDIVSMEAIISLRIVYPINIYKNILCGFVG